MKFLMLFAFIRIKVNAQIQGSCVCGTKTSRCSWKNLNTYGRSTRSTRLLTRCWSRILRKLSWILYYFIILLFCVRYVDLSFMCIWILTLILSGLLQPNTAICPKKYDIDNEDDDFLGEMCRFIVRLWIFFLYKCVFFFVEKCWLGPNGELRLFLEGVAEAKDVQSYVKDHPFGEPAITPSHPDWKYYSKIIRFFEKKRSSDTDHKKWYDSSQMGCHWLVSLIC